MSERRIRSLKRALNDLLVIDKELYDESTELTDSPDAMKAFIDDYVRNPVPVKDFKVISTSFTTPFPKRTQRHMTERYVVRLQIREIRRELMSFSKGKMRRVR